MTKSFGHLSHVLYISTVLFCNDTFYDRRRNVKHICITAKLDHIVTINEHNELEVLSASLYRVHKYLEDTRRQSVTYLFEIVVLRRYSKKKHDFFWRYW